MMEPRPLIALACLTLLALFLVLLLRTLGLLESLELKAYDAYLRLAADHREQSQPLVMVEYTEADEAAFGFPLPDDRLAGLFEVLTAKGAVAIGLDLIRDRAEPKTTDRAAFERLSQVLRDNPSIVGITGEGAGTFGPPPALEDRPAQIATATILPDADETIRRGLLLLPDNDGKRRPALAFRLAERYLEAKNLTIGRPTPDRLRLGDRDIIPFSPDQSGFYRRSAGFGGGFQQLLTFPACRTGFERHPLGDLLNERADGIDLRGKIVLIGNTVRAAKDVVDVPMDCAGLGGGKMFGVHLHGHIVSQLIGLAEGELSPLETSEQKFGGPLIGSAIDGGWIWFWTIIGGLIALLLPSPLWLVTSAAFAVLALILSTFWLFSAAGWWLPAIPPALGFALAITLAITYGMTRARTEREQAMALFAGVVSKRVADAIWQGRGRPEGEELQLLTATVMFTDIKGFTTISEKLPEPVLATWLDDYIAAMVDIVARHGGVIEKFAGDGLTVEFGVPEPRLTEAEIDADARSAIDCALAMAEALPALNTGWRANQLPEIGIRIGLHTGPLMVGVIGSADRWQYSIIGDTANTAARIEGYGQDDPRLACNVGDCRILASEATCQRLDDEIKTEWVGEASLKGKASTIGIFRIHGRSIR